MTLIPQPVVESEQDEVDRLMVYSRINEAIANLLKIRDHFLTQRPTQGRTKAIAAADKAIATLREHLEGLR